MRGAKSDLGCSDVTEDLGAICIPPLSCHGILHSNISLMMLSVFCRIILGLWVNVVTGQIFNHFTVNLERLSTSIKLLQMPILPLHTDLALSKYLQISNSSCREDLDQERQHPACAKVCRKARYSVLLPAPEYFSSLRIPHRPAALNCISSLPGVHEQIEMDHLKINSSEQALSP